MAKHKNPWKVLTSKTVYQNQWINVREDSVTRPDGSQGIFGVVEIQEGVAILPVDSEGRLYLTREYHYAVAKETIEAVSGGINPNENSLAAAKRELAEELGIIALNYEYLGPLYPLTSIVKLTNHLYIANNLSFVAPRPDSTEVIQAVVTTLDEAVEWIKSGVISDATTVSLVLKYKTFLTR